MDKYLEAEKRLASLLGYTDINVVGISIFGFHKERTAGLHWPSTERFYIPHWCRDNAAAFVLMVQHECYPTEDKHHDGVSVADDDTWGNFQFWQEHPDKETAVRFAIVQSVIAKLEANRDRT